MTMKNLVGTSLPMIIYFLMFCDVTQTSHYKLDREMCYTEACNNTANLLSLSMNRSASPCDDFYNYTCGLQHLDSNNSKLGISSSFKYETITKVLHLIDRIEPNDPVKPFRLLKTYIKSCRNYSEIEDRKLFSNILWKLGFNLNQKTDHTSKNEQFDWINTAKILTDNGLITQFLFRFTIQLNSALKNSIMLKKGIRLTGYTNKNIREDLIETNHSRNSYIKKFLTDMNDSSDGINIDKLRGEIFQEVFDFEDKMIEIANSGNNHVEVTLKNLSIIAPNIPWLSFIQTVLSSLSNINIDENEIIGIQSLKYMQDLDKLINNTSTKVLLNYIVYSIHLRYFLHIETDKPVSENSCITNNYPFMDAACLLLAKAMTPKDKLTRRYILRLSEKIRQELLHTINYEWDWMDRKIKTIAIKKLKSLSIVVAYNDLKAEMKKIIQYYDDFEIYGHSFFSIHMEILKFELRDEIKMLHKSVNNRRTIPYSHFLIYDAIQNTIFIPTGFYQIVNTERPEYQNLVLAWDIAEWMASAIIGKNRIYDEHGKVTNWWSESSERNYDKIVSCFQDQYKNLSINGEAELDNEEKLSLALSGNLGFQIIHRLYRKWLKDKKNSAWKLFDYNDTIDQMFFTIAELMYCDYQSYRIPNQYIFRGVASNIPEFERAFTCQKGTAMNPKKKCKF